MIRATVQRTLGAKLTMGLSMARSFSLLVSPWLPVRRANGASDWISPAELTNKTKDGAILAFAWPRPDFDLAAHEFMIGLLAVACPPRDEDDWLRRFRQPPSSDELAAAFAPYEDAFVLDGEGPRFLQDYEALNAKASPIEALLIDAPGANTVELNKDLFVKRGGVKLLSRAGAAMALYTLQQFAPAGGAGYRTSLRGGGPLVTLAIPGAVDSAHPPTLWQRVWLNVPTGVLPAASARERIFPWLVPTITSANGESVSVEGAHPLQAHFGMPRRIRLVLETNEARAPCSLTGLIDDPVVTGFVAEPRGVNYGVWRHPLTPYRRAKNNLLPVHTPAGRIGYRDWLGLVYDANKGSLSPATAMHEARQRLAALEEDASGWRSRPILFAGGFATSDAKAISFTEAELPLHLVHDEGLAGALSEFASILVGGAAAVSSLLTVALRIALFGEKGKAGFDSTVLDAPRERLWDETDSEFHHLLDVAIEQLTDDDNSASRNKLKERWRRTLEKTALTIFDEVAPIDEFGELDPGRIVSARKLIALGLKGYGKYGRSLFEELVLPPPEGTQKRGKSTRRKIEESTK